MLDTCAMMGTTFFLILRKFYVASNFVNAYKHDVLFMHFVNPIYVYLNIVSFAINNKMIVNILPLFFTKADDSKSICSKIKKKTKCPSTIRQIPSHSNAKCQSKTYTSLTHFV